jgi:hypothetical protein
MCSTFIRVNVRFSFTKCLCAFNNFPASPSVEPVGIVLASTDKTKKIDLWQIQLQTTLLIGKDQ